MYLKHYTAVIIRFSSVELLAVMRTPQPRHNEIHSLVSFTFSDSILFLQKFLTRSHVRLSRTDSFLRHSSIAFRPGNLPANTYFPRCLKTEAFSSSDQGILLAMLLWVSTPSFFVRVLSALRFGALTSANIFQQVISSYLFYRLLFLHSVKSYKMNKATADTWRTKRL